MLKDELPKMSGVSFHSWLFWPGRESYPDFYETSPGFTTLLARYRYFDVTGNYFLFLRTIQCTK